MTTPGLRLHLGCGKRHIPGFTHVDIADFPHIDHRHRIDRLPMFADGSADLIYSAHAFEYFDRVEAIEVLGEWRRVLRPGGVLRLAVPDFAALTTLYLRTGNLDLILGPLFGRMAVDAEGGPTTIYHRTTYDYASLSDLCRRAGFADVRRYDWRETGHGAHDDFSQAYFPHLNRETGLLLSLNIEAARP